MNEKKNKFLKSYFSYMCHDRSSKRDRHDDAGCPELGRPNFCVCWMKTTHLGESKPSPAGAMKEA
jgi:hypothetical protein